MNDDNRLDGQDGEMIEEEADIVEFTDEEGNSLLLEVLDTFYYNGEEFAVLGDVEEEEHEHTDECEHNLYIMKIETSTDENGEEIEEFIPVEESMMDALVEIVQTRFMEDDEDDDE